MYRRRRHLRQLRRQPLLLIVAEKGAHAQIVVTVSIVIRAPAVAGSVQLTGAALAAINMLLMSAIATAGLGVHKIALVIPPAANCNSTVVLTILLAVILYIVVPTAEAGDSALGVRTTANALRVGPVSLEHAYQLRSLLMLQAMASR